MKKKGEMQQVFMYILGVVIMGLLLLFAYRGIKSIMVTSENADIEKFKTDFTNLIDEMSAFGRGRVDTITTPANYAKLCLIDQTSFLDPSSILPTGIDVVDVSVAAHSDNTVYLVSADGSTVEAFKTKPMTIVNSANQFKNTCFDISLGKIKLNLQGQSKFTIVKEVKEA